MAEALAAGGHLIGTRSSEFKRYDKATNHMIRITIITIRTNHRSKAGDKARPVLFLESWAPRRLLCADSGLLFAFDKLDEMNRPEPSTRVELPEGRASCRPSPRSGRSRHGRPDAAAT
jgi:hypothetical protein